MTILYTHEFSENYYTYANKRVPKMQTHHLLTQTIVDKKNGLET